ncbi:unnamed protein product, partial [Heterotrigona itama]
RFPILIGTIPLYFPCSASQYYIQFFNLIYEKICDNTSSNANANIGIIKCIIPCGKRPSIS